MAEMYDVVSGRLLFFQRPRRGRPQDFFKESIFIRQIPTLKVVFLLACKNTKNINKRSSLVLYWTLVLAASLT